VGDAYHYILMQILMAARAHGKQAIDGPYLQIKDVDGFRRVAGARPHSASTAMGAASDQIAAANEVYSPRQEDYEHAEDILDAYDHFTSAAGGGRGAVMLGDEMIDEASRKMALVVSAKGRAAGLTPTTPWTPPPDPLSLPFSRRFVRTARTCGQAPSGAAV
jgi:citrate lyase subunit beta/citryl-CoA lyase